MLSKPPSQVLPRSEQPGFNRALGKLECLADLVIGHPLYFAKHKDLAMFRGELIEHGGQVEPAVDGDLGRRDPRRRAAVHRRQPLVDLDRLAHAPASPGLGCLIGNDPHEPGLDRTPPLERADPAECAQERLLQNVLGIGGIAGQRKRQPEQLVGEQIDQLLECRRVLATKPLEKLGILARSVNREGPRLPESIGPAPPLAVS